MFNGCMQFYWEEIMAKKFKEIRTNIYELAFTHLKKKGIPINEINTMQVLNAIVEIVNKAHAKNFRFVKK